MRMTGGGPFERVVRHGKFRSNDEVESPGSVRYACLFDIAHVIRYVERTKQFLLLPEI
jgi:hypothetical protein